VELSGGRGEVLREGGKVLTTMMVLRMRMMMVMIIYDNLIR